MKDKQYSNMNEVLEDAEKDLRKDTKPVVMETNPMFADMKYLASKLQESIDEINKYMQTWSGQFEPAGLINLRTNLQQQRDNLSYM